MNNHNEHIEQHKHVRDPYNDEIILAHIRENEKSPYFLFFIFQNFQFLGIFVVLKHKWLK